MGFITIFQNHLRSYFWIDFVRGFEKRTSYPYAPWDWNIYLHESHKILVKCSQIYHTWSILVGFMVEKKKWQRTKPPVPSGIEFDVPEDDCKNGQKQ